MARIVSQHVPGGALADHIASVTIVERDPAAVDQIFTLPRGQATLVFCLRSEQPLSATGAAVDAEGVLRFLGPATKSYSKQVSGVPQSVIVRFRTASAFPFLQVPMHSLADGMTDLDTMVGLAARNLARSMAQAASTAARIQLLKRFLLKQLDCSSERTLRKGLQLAHALPPVSQASPTSKGDAGFSSRQMRRLFNDYVGLSPYTIQRIERFSQAARLARCAPETRWGDVAAQLGYYDQAHMIGDFREFVGVTPCQFLPALRAGFPHLTGSWFPSPATAVSG
jgi:hypothetical protein